MASIGRDPGGLRRILFVAPDGKRKTIRLGKCSQRFAESFKLRVEQLLAANALNQPPDSELSAWLAGLDGAFSKKLASVGLIDPRQDEDDASSVKLGAFLHEYIAGRPDLAVSTVHNLNQAARRLISYFGENKPLSDITEGDADQFRIQVHQDVGENTARRHLGRAKQFFRNALRKRLVPSNPFADQKGCSVKANSARDYFLTREDSAKILETCPDSEWRLIFALSRFGGLRCPSEHLSLTWDCVDWGRSRLRVPSPKTKHHGQDHAERIIPIFPELRPYLESVFEQAEPFDRHRPETAFVIRRYRNVNQNLRTTFEKIIRRAGLVPWEKLFQNLRVTRATELASEYPAHVAAEWLGHSTVVAQKHYWRTTDADFEKAIQTTKTGSEKAAQNPAQYVAVLTRREMQAALCENRKSPEILHSAVPGYTVHPSIMPPDGLEPSTL